MSGFSASEEEGNTRIWINFDTYRKLLKVRYLMTRKNGKLRTFDETIKEPIEFWAKHTLNDLQLNNTSIIRLKSSKETN